MGNFQLLSNRCYTHMRTHTQADRAKTSEGLVWIGERRFLMINKKWWDMINKTSSVSTDKQHNWVLSRHLSNLRFKTKQNWTALSASIPQSQLLPQMLTNSFWISHSFSITSNTSLQHSSSKSNSVHDNSGQMQYPFPALHMWHARLLMWSISLNSCLIWKD